MADLKKVFYKVYDSNDVYITTWNADVASVPSFTWSINGSMGQLTVDLARPVDDFGETEDVAMFNKVKTYVQDGDSTSAIAIHSGSIISYNYFVAANGEQKIRVYVLSFTEGADKLVLKDGSGNTTLTYNSYEPADIMKSVLNYMAGDISYNSSTIENTSTTVSYPFKYTSYLDAIKKILELCPAYWYWYLDANNLLHLKSTDFDTINHVLYLGREVQSIDVFKTIEKMYNTVFFLGGDTGGGTLLYKKYTSGGSVAQYGPREYRMQDSRVTTAATAQIMAAKFLEENDHFNQELTVVVLDNNASDGNIGGVKGYDIESLKPGDVVKVFHPKIQSNLTLWYSDDLSLGNFIWDVSFWNYDIRYSLGIPMQIQEIQYNFYSATIKLSTTLPDIPKRIEDLERNLIETESIDIPTIPS